MQRVAIVLTVCLLFLAALPARAGASGQCQYQEHSARFVDGVAWEAVDDDTREPTGELVLALTTFAPDSAAIWRVPPEQRDDALRDQESSADASARLQLTLDPDDSVHQQFLWFSPGTSLSRSGSAIGEYVAGKAESGRIKGHYRFAGDPDDPRCDVDFDLPVLGDPAQAPPPPGKPLPAGGGEPGRVYLSGNAAILAGDLDAMAALLPPDKAAALAKAREQPEFAAQLAFMQAITPRDVRIVGGRQDGERAWLEITATEDGQPRAGTVELRRQDGRWFVVKESTRGPD